MRITTRYDEHDLGASLFPTLHEFGHALYESGVDPALERTPLADLQSLGLHEAQSRIWENAVGRSLPFWRYFCPHVEMAFPSQLRGVTAEQFHRAVNKVQPSLIRVEADELTYDLHIILRFELERDIFSGAARARATCPRPGTRRCAPTWGSTFPTTCAACCRTSTGPRARSATSRPTPSGT